MYRNCKARLAVRPLFRRKVKSARVSRATTWSSAAVAHVPKNAGARDRFYHHHHSVTLNLGRTISRRSTFILLCSLYLTLDDGSAPRVRTSTRGRSNHRVWKLSPPLKTTRNIAAVYRETWTHQNQLIFGYPSWTSLTHYSLVQSRTRWAEKMCFTFQVHSGRTMINDQRFTGIHSLYIREATFCRIWVGMAWVARRKIVV